MGDFLLIGQSIRLVLDYIDYDQNVWHASRKAWIMYDPQELWGEVTG